MIKKVLDKSKMQKKYPLFSYNYNKNLMRNINHIYTIKDF